MQVKDVMTKRVIALKPDDSVKNALILLSKKGISGAPVEKGGKVVGILSQTDLVRFIDYHTPKIYYKSSKLFPLVLALIKGNDDFSSTKKALGKLNDLKVRDIMTKKVLSVNEDDDVLVAANLMDVNRINRLPVLRRKKLCGIVSRADIIRALAFD
jgi:CBS domain-containing protein